ncbi:MAG: DUF1491 family protein [Hyphomicrobiales bacterium]|nr:DUF1491 family protein [Hyphomicrobiales bacterium]MDE2016216.1 DUF1491 family protein [Hyphomicrobiales bacterium]
MRLRADIWVAAYLRRCAVEGAQAYLTRRGSPEAGAIFVRLDRLDGRVALFAPAPQSELDDSGDRRFARRHREEWIDAAAAAEAIRREGEFDPDLWLVDVDDRAGRHFLDLAEGSAAPPRN